MARHLSNNKKLGQKGEEISRVKKKMVKLFRQCLKPRIVHPQSMAPLPATAPLKKLWLLFIRCAIVIIVATLCLLLLYTTPLLVTRLSATLFHTGASQAPEWISNVLTVLYTFFILTVCFPFLLTLGWLPLSRHEKNSTAVLPFVSIVIPAFNEEKAIMRSLEALQNLDYPRFEVIVVNDGSTDFTFSIIEQARVKYIHLRKNQGKAAALNAGIAEAKGAIIVFSDSDSLLHPMALRYLIQGFYSPAVGAVSGTVEIERANNLLKQWQVIEYTFGQFFVKVAQLGSCSSVAICPGPVCAFRKELLLKIGGFSGRTITEDFDATLAIIESGYLINYAPQAIAYTDAPSTWKALESQRLRWFRGHIQTFRLHRGLLFNPETGALGLYWLPIYYLFLGYACSTIELLLMLIVPILFFASGSGLTMLQTSIIYILFAHIFLSAGYALVLHHSQRLTWRLFLAVCLIYPYLVFLNWLRVCAISNELRGKIVTWSG